MRTAAQAVLAIICVLLLFAVLPAMAEDMIYTDDVGDTIVLKETPCPPEVLRHIPQGNRGFYGEAVMTVKGVSTKACHALVTLKTRPGLFVQIVNETGATRIFDANDFDLVEKPRGI